MNYRFGKLLFVMGILLLFAITELAFAGGLFIRGTILNPEHIAIPGVGVSFKSVESRTFYVKPVYTDDLGRFEMVIPPENPKSLYLEVYWNQDLMFRQPLRSLPSENLSDEQWTDVERYGMGEIILRPIVLGRSPGTPVQTPREAIKATPGATASPPQQPPEGRQIDYFFSALPSQVFTTSPPSDLLLIIKSGGDNIFDLANGYMFLKGDGAQISLQIALFLYDANRRPLLAIAWGDQGGPDFTRLSFFSFNEKDGRMVQTNRTIFPVPDSERIRFELPRVGQTVKVWNSNGKLLSEWTWNSDHARFEKGPHLGN
jgi:hypothetical protein